MDKYYARKSIKKICIYILICFLIAVVSAYSDYKFLAGIVSIPFIILIGIEWFKAIFFKCPKCKSIWPFGFKSKCVKCGAKYGDSN